MKHQLGLEVTNNNRIGRIVAHVGGNKYRVRFQTPNWPFPTEELCSFSELTITNTTDRDLSEQYEEALL